MFPGINSGAVLKPVSYENPFLKPIYYNNCLQTICSSEACIHILIRPAETVSGPSAANLDGRSNSIPENRATGFRLRQGSLTSFPGHLAHCLEFVASVL